VRFLGSYSTKPIYVFGGLGMISMVLAFFFLVVVILQKVFAEQKMNTNVLLNLSVMLVMMAIQFTLMGLLAEIMVRTYHESQGRPTYVVRDRLPAPPEEDE
jgi:uncharacterized membrane protein YagU involved in acid resistance